MTEKAKVSEPGTKRDLIVEELRSLIASGELPRGARVRQEDLAIRFGTSNTPIREALRQLEAEGLLRSEPYRGVSVSETNPEDIRGVYVARALLEPFAAQLATLRVSRRDISHVADLNAAMKQALQEGDRAGVRSANRDFHFLIYEKCAVPSLVSIIEGLWLQFPWDVLDVLDSRVALSIGEHSEIVGCLEQGDIASIGSIFQQHIIHSYESLAKHLTGHEPGEDPLEEVRKACE